MSVKADNSSEAGGGPAVSEHLAVIANSTTQGVDGNNEAGNCTNIKEEPKDESEPEAVPEPVSFFLICRFYFWF